MDGNSLTLYIGGIIIILVSAFLIVRPLRQEQEQEEVDELENKITTLQKDKESIFTALNEIEFDYNTNKLGDEDYHKLKIRYQQQAVMLLKREKEFKGEDTAELSFAELENQLTAELTKEIEIELDTLQEN